jgi:hypothetical protein
VRDKLHPRTLDEHLGHLRARMDRLERRKYNNMPAGDSTLFYQDQQNSGGTNAKVPLTYVPLAGSEHVYWRGAYQSSTLWTLEDDAKVVINDPDLAAGDLITVEYAHSGTETVFPLMTVMRVKDLGGGGVDTFPAGTAIGDTFVIGTNGPGYSNFYEGSDQVLKTFYPPDSSPGARVYVGKVDRLDSFRLDIFPSNVMNNAAAVVWTFPGEVDLKRVTHGARVGAGDIVLPKVSGKGSAALIVLQKHGGLGGSYGVNSCKDISPAQTSWTFTDEDGSYHTAGGFWRSTNKVEYDVAVYQRGSGVATATMLGIFA